mgnify:CR=1 FL=1
MKWYRGYFRFFFQAEDGIRDVAVTGVQTCALPIYKHNLQTDYWVCIKGSFKVGLATEEDGCKFEYLSDKNPRVLEITPGIYHGYKALEPGSILLYYVTRKYDIEDEIRRPIGHFGEQWETENK